MASSIEVTFRAEGLYLKWAHSENISEAQVNALFEEHKFDLWMFAGKSTALTFTASQEDLTNEAVSKICSAIKSFTHASALYNIGQEIKNEVSSPCRKIAKKQEKKDAAVVLKALDDMAAVMVETRILIKMNAIDLDLTAKL
jgi:hypothetical protein